MDKDSNSEAKGLLMKLFLAPGSFNIKDMNRLRSLIEAYSR